MSTCTHPDRRCLNQHELVRKYACPDCFEVMMCACDQEVGERCLSHQLGYATESTTQDRIRVTSGFQQGICSECRGLPADVAPAAAIHGRTSKIKRYYWREIMFRQLVLLQNWYDAGGPEHGPEFDTAFERFGREALEDIKQLHAATPKYEYNEPSAAQIIEKHGVDVVQIPAVHKQRTGERIAIEDGTELLTPEDYVLRHYQRRGYNGLKVESTPFHVLFGTLLYPVLSDPRDPKQRQVSFAREATPEFADGLVTMLQPHDFGTSGYARRRALEIDRHLASEELGPRRNREYVRVPAVLERATAIVSVGYRCSRHPDSPAVDEGAAPRCIAQGAAVSGRRLLATVRWLARPATRQQCRLLLGGGKIIERQAEPGSNGMDRGKQ